MSILIPNPQHLQTMIDNIIRDGKEYFHVIADFDRTLTQAFVDGKPRSSLESVFEEQGLLGPDFSLQAKKNFEKYYPMEMDPTLSLDKKKAAMQERRMTQFALMIRCGITKDMINRSMQSDKVVLRKGSDLFFSLLQEKNIPLLIFSASGLGYQAIQYFLTHEQKFSSNINIISNDFIRDEEGRAIGVKEPIIHSYNKNETIVHELPLYDKIVSRKNILLLGDSLGDVHMADGFAYENIIRIGFLNHDTPEHRQQYQEKFDLIILNDGPMDEINKLIQGIVI